jgi:hypothetical protein
MSATVAPEGPAPRWRRLVSGAFSALLLLPVPVFALTFSGSWSITSTTATGDAPVPQGFQSGNRKSLRFELGNYLASTADSSNRIVAQNTFTVPAGGEVVTILSTQSVEVQQGNYSVRVEFFDAGGTELSAPSLAHSGGGGLTPNMFSDPWDTSGYLPALPAGQTYMVRVTITTAAFQGGEVSSSAFRLTFGP